MGVAWAIPAASGDEHLPEALEGLDQGLERLGPLVTLLSLCVDIEVALGRIDAALVRLATRN